VQADLADLGECKQLIDSVVKKFGRINVLVNNAGVSTPAASELSLEKRWQTMMDVNLRAPFFLSTYARPHMPKGGCIVNLSSIRAFKPKNVLSVYGTSKAGLNYLTRSLARDFAPKVRVNAVAPGYVRTEMVEKFYGNKMDQLEKETPIGRMIRPEEIASAVVFLSENDAITGQTLVVDGGYLIS
ncbi:MAG TPA: SDR family oxidoreductase, partial [Candidatus Norongarragalinales archaeon]|nr:SDR family oxidoreductase [Candidatus Norongarragalinales archaeon]